RGYDKCLCNSVVRWVPGMTVTLVTEPAIPDPMMRLWPGMHVHARLLARVFPYRGSDQNGIAPSGPLATQPSTKAGPHTRFGKGLERWEDAVHHSDFRF